MDTVSAGIYYKVYGAGTPLLMLHGNAGSHREFLSYAKKLSDSYQVILMDSRGHGRSRLKRRAETSEFTVADMADDVRRLMNTLRLDKGFLLGFSDGANTALEFAARYPGRTLGVIAVSGNALPGGLWTPLYLLTFMKYHISGFLRRLFPENRLGKHLIKSRMLSGLMLNSPALTKERLAQIKAPVLLIAGTLDVVKVSHTKWMAEQIPNSHLKLITGGTHGSFFYKKEQQRYLTYIKSFLSKALSTLKSNTSLPKPARAWYNIHESHEQCGKT